MEKLLLENVGKFAGLKFHPKKMGLAADKEAYEGGAKVSKCEFSRPEQIYSLAKKCPKVPVILGHLGGNSGADTKAAVDIMVESINKGSATIFADISWVNCDTTEKPDIIEAIRRLKSTEKWDMTERLLFGTDAPIGRFGKEEQCLKPIQAYEKVVNDVKNAIKKRFSN